MSVVTPNFFRGHTETIILSILEKNDSYGYEIGKIITDVSDGVLNVTETALYNAFRKMELDGTIIPYWKDGANGTRRRYYSLTLKGKEVLDELRKEWRIGKVYLDKLIGGDFYDS